MPDSPPHVVAPDAYPEVMGGTPLAPTRRVLPGVEVNRYEITKTFSGGFPALDGVVLAIVASLETEYSWRLSSGSAQHLGPGGVRPMTILPPRHAIEHMTWRRGSGTTTHVHLGADRIARAAADLEADPARVALRDDLLALDDPLLLHLTAALARAAEDPAGRVYAETLATSTATHLVLHHTEAPPTERGPRGGVSGRALRAVEDVVRSRLGEALALADLAGAAGLSEYHFSREYKRSTGEAPFEMVRRLRMEEAARLLRETALGALAVGVAVGYGSAAAFSTAFRRHHGLTPTAYRRHAR